MRIAHARTRARKPSVLASCSASFSDQCSTVATRVLLWLMMRYYASRIFVFVE
jgi:hypothetical protein